MPSPDSQYEPTMLAPELKKFLEEAFGECSEADLRHQLRTVQLTALKKEEK